MDRPNVTSHEAARCLSILESADRPIVAAELAARLFLRGNRETRRRHVRAIIKKLRDNGSMIIATLQGGYSLTGDEQLWKDYLEGRQIDVKRILGEAHRRKRMVADSAGQGVLFGQGVTCGIG